MDFIGPPRSWHLLFTMFYGDCDAYYVEVSGEPGDRPVILSLNVGADTPRPERDAAVFEFIEGFVDGSYLCWAGLEVEKCDIRDDDHMPLVDASFIEYARCRIEEIISLDATAPA